MRHLGDYQAVRVPYGIKVLVHPRTNTSLSHCCYNYLYVWVYQHRTNGNVTTLGCSLGSGTGWRGVEGLDRVPGHHASWVSS